MMQKEATCQMHSINEMDTRRKMIFVENLEVEILKQFIVPIICLKKHSVAMSKNSKGISSLKSNGVRLKVDLLSLIHI